MTERATLHLKEKNETELLRRRPFNLLAYFPADSTR